MHSITYEPPERPWDDWDDSGFPRPRVVDDPEGWVVWSRDGDHLGPPTALDEFEAFWAEEIARLNWRLEEVGR